MIKAKSYKQLWIDEFNKAIYHFELEAINLKKWYYNMHLSIEEEVEIRLQYRELNRKISLLRVSRNQIIKDLPGYSLVPKRFPHRFYLSLKINYPAIESKIYAEWQFRIAYKKANKSYLRQCNYDPSDITHN
jgi:hypothetical protein